MSHGTFNSIFSNIAQTKPNIQKRIVSIDRAHSHLSNIWPRPMEWLKEWKFVWMDQQKMIVGCAVSNTRTIPNIPNLRLGMGSRSRTRFNTAKEHLYHWKSANLWRFSGGLSSEFSKANMEFRERDSNETTQRIAFEDCGNDYSRLMSRWSRCIVLGG